MAASWVNISTRYVIIAVSIGIIASSFTLFPESLLLTPTAHFQREHDLIPHNTKNYRPDIDGLRAIAVLVVLFFHLEINPFSGGYVGVDVFFVISGFLITGILKKELEQNGRLNFKSFYIRRINRLLPALVVTVLFSSILGALILSPAHLSELGGAAMASLTSVSNVYFWFQADYFDTSAKLKPLLHTWSLSVEEQFYLIWPLLLALVFKVKIKSIRPSIILLIGVLSLVLNIIFGGGSVQALNFIPGAEELFSDGRATIFFLLPFRVFEFVIGALLVWTPQLRDSKAGNMLMELCGWIGLCLIAYASMVFNEELLFPSLWALAPCLGTAALIYSGERSHVSKILASKVFVKIGLISYSLYLVHWPIIVFWEYVTDEIPWPHKIVLLIIFTLLALLLHRYVEIPFRRSKLIFSSFRTKTASVVLLLALLATGYSMFHSGWTWRLSKSVVFENLSDAKNFHKKFYGGAGYPSYGPVDTKGPADLVLLGDSHARHYAEGLYKELAQPNSLNLYIAAGTSCFHLPKFTRVTKGYDWDQMCPERLAKALTFIKSSPDTVVITSYSYISQIRIAGLLDNQGHRTTKKVTIDDVVHGILELKEQIGDRQLVVIGAVPRTGGINLFDAFSRPRLPLLFNKDVEQLLSSPQPEAQVSINHTLKQAAEDSGMFVFLDPHQVLCTDGRCRNVDASGHLIYSDSGHLSRYGSIEVISAFVPLICNTVDTLCTNGPP